MYKIVNQLVPDYLHPHCPDLVSRTCAYNTRQSNSLRFPICRTSAFKNSFFPSTARYWNGIDIHTRNSESETAECLCGDIETPQHYILKCPLYSAPRNKLLKAIRDIIAPGVHHSILPHLDPILFVNIVLKGCNDVQADENVNIFKAFQHFIIESGRFK